MVDLVWGVYIYTYRLDFLIMQFREVTSFLKVVEVGLLQSSSKALFSTTQITVSAGSRRATYCRDYSYSQTKSVTNANLCHHVRFHSLKTRGEKDLAVIKVSTWWHTYSMDKKNPTSPAPIYWLWSLTFVIKKPVVIEDLTCTHVSTECPFCAVMSPLLRLGDFLNYVFSFCFLSVTLYEEDAFTFVADLLGFVKCCVYLLLLFSVLETPWCSPIKVKHGYANCRTPQGEYYKNVLGTRCDIRCQKGYELHGPQQLICQSSKRWSGKVLCKRK